MSFKEIKQVSEILYQLACARELDSGLAGIDDIRAVEPAGVLQCLSATAKEAQTMNEQRFPKGWDAERIKQLIAELDARTDEEWVAAHEAAYAAEGITMMAIPTELVPEVRALLARKHSA